jgi:mono/diheme cytochrome c family protein
VFSDRFQQPSDQRPLEQRQQTSASSARYRLRPAFCPSFAALSLSLAIYGWSMVAVPLVAQDDAFQRDALPFLDQYCVACHMSDDAEGGIALDSFLDQTTAVQGGETWMRVWDAVEGGVMPPQDDAQPSLDERERFLDWIRNDFIAAQCAQSTSTAAVVLRRLNRQEYNNTIRDLIGLELDLAANFPPDDIGFGYDNIGSALTTSPMHLEKYLDAAEAALDGAIVVPDVEEFSPVELIGLRTYPLPPDGSVEFEHHLAAGRYLADFSLVRAGIDEAVPPPKLSIGFGSDSRNVEAARVQDETVVYRFWLQVVDGDHMVHVSVAKDQSTDGSQLATEDTANTSGDQRYGKDHGLHVDSMVVRGPYQVAAESLPAVHRQILITTPGLGDEARLAAGRQVIERFAQRAFRRPVTAHEVDRVMRIFRTADERGESFERSLQVALAAVLVSPQFLFLVEPEYADEFEPGAGDRPLSDYELASRLSYYLWSSMPDETLLREAEQGTLRSNLRDQVVRMLNDAKSQAFVNNFVGQWLLLRNLDGAVPDKALFPDFNDELRQAMRTETELFFADLLRNNRSALELLNSDYTFLNERLAQHYQIDAVSGPEFRRVELADGRRGGVMTQASILTLTSNHNRTSPVKRGQWILQQLLGTPPPPPPPDVAKLDESPQAAQTASLRERLEVHRADPQCAACHHQMDPLGFALENYDAIGRWRTSDGEFAIDASGELLDQQRFEDAQELKLLLKSTATRKFSWCLIENMLTYGLGRALEPSDYCTVETIRKRLESDDYRIQQIVFGIVESDAFLRRSVAP